MCIPSNESKGVDVVTELTYNVIPRCGISLVGEHLVQDQEVGAVLFNHIEVVLSEHIVITRIVVDPDCLAVVAISRWVQDVGVMRPLDFLELVTEVIAGGLGCCGGLGVHQGCR